MLYAASGVSDWRNIMNFVEILNPKQVIHQLAAACGGLSQVSLEMVGQALAGRFINSCGSVRDIDPEVLKGIFQQAALAWDEEGDVDLNAGQIHIGFNSRFGVELSAPGFLSTFLPQGEVEQGLKDWATGKDQRQVVYGTVPDHIADIRAEWDSAWK